MPSNFDDQPKEMQSSADSLPKPLPPILLARAGTPLPLLSLVVGVLVVLMVLLLPLLQMPKIYGPLLAGFGPQSLVISRREPPRNSKVLSK